MQLFLFLKISLNPTSSSSLNPISLFPTNGLQSIILTNCISSSSCVLEPFQQAFHPHHSNTDTTLFKVANDFDFGGFLVFILLSVSSHGGTAASSILLDTSSSGFQNFPAPDSSPSPPQWLVLLSFPPVFSLLLTHKH